MTIRKTYVIQIQYNDRTIAHPTVKATTAKQAVELITKAYPDTYVCEPADRLSVQKKYWKKYWKSLVSNVDIADSRFTGRGDRFGQYLFQHKGRKRKGMKNYPTPKHGWSKWYAPVSFTWKEEYTPAAAGFIGKWVKDLVGEKPTAIETT